jgi:hypothetical protein
MSMARSARAATAIGVMLALTAGCSSTNSPQNPTGPTVGDDLVEVAGLLKDYAGEFNRGPTKLADLTKNQPLYPRGYQAIQAGQIVVIWGVKVRLDGSGPSNVVAYEKNAEAQGGSVLLENGELKKMSTAEFQAAPKAKKAG